MRNRIRHNSPSPIQCLRIYPYWSCCVIIAIITVTLAIKLLPSLLPLPLLPSLLSKLSYYFVTDYLLLIINLQVWLNWQLSCQYMQIFSGSPCVKYINLGWILYPQKLLRSSILVGYQDLFLAPLPGSIAIFVESIGILSIYHYEESEGC